MFKFIRRNRGQITEKPSCQPRESSPIPLIEVVPRDTQALIRGTKLRFSEDLDYNLTLLAQRLPNPQLVCEEFAVGSLAQRKVTVVYLKNRANPGIVQEVKDRISKIKAETVLDGSYIERNIQDSSLSPFPQVEVTMQPDVSESALLQGRVVIVVDGSPEVLLAPTTFFDLMDTPEDAFMRWPAAATFFKIARYIMFIIAVSLPGFYIALTSYNSDALPTQLIYLILESREDTPFPIYFEAFLMMGIAEAIRMMLLRLPSQVGSTIALFGGITLVGAGIYANFISPSVVIIVTLTVISSFGIPNFDLRVAVRLFQFGTMVLSAFLGLFGFAMGAFYIMIHLAVLKSFGIPYMTPLAPLEASGLNHTVFRESTEIMAQDETYKPLTGSQTKNKRSDN